MNQRGFTILELIVVVVIIGILVSLVIPATTNARNRARVAKASSHIGAIEMGLTAFQNDFGSYPDASGGTAETDNPFIVEVLTGFEFSGGSKSASSHALVTDSRWSGPYLEIDVADTDTNGNMIDPWSNPYNFALDLDGDPGTTPPTNNVYTYDVWSNGPDGTSGNGDDVTNY